MSLPDISFDDLFAVLSDAHVEFILIGGLAAIAHGSSRATFDVDIVYRRSDDNYKRLAESLASHNPYLRDAPPGLPFVWDEMTIRSGLNFTLRTSLGDLDLLGEVVGGGRYEDLLPSSFPLEFFGRQIRCVTLDQLIMLKRAAGRPKDLEAVAELIELRNEQNKQD